MQPETLGKENSPLPASSSLPTSDSGFATELQGSSCTPPSPGSPGCSCHCGAEAGPSARCRETGPHLPEGANVSQAQSPPVKVFTGTRDQLLLLGGPFCYRQSCSQGLVGGSAFGGPFVRQVPEAWGQGQACATQGRCAHPQWQCWASSRADGGTTVGHHHHLGPGATDPSSHTWGVSTCHQ